MSDKMRAFRNAYMGQRAYLLGNGPSLAEVDLHSLGGVTFGSNRIYLSGFTPDVYVAVNPLVVQQFYREIGELDTVKFIAAQALEGLPAGWNQEGEVIPIDTSLRLPAFGNVEGVIWEGHTVTYVMLQLAYYMGIVEAALLGVDHDYGEHGRRPNLELAATGPDQHHFHPDYFANGTRWNAPDLASSELAYSLAKEQWEHDHRRIVNASGRTKLRVFPLESLNRFRGKLDNPKYLPRVSAIISAYFAGDYLCGCLTDLCQSTEDIEIVVVCKRGSEEDHIVSSFESGNAPGWMIREGRIVIVRTEDIPTVYKAWNLGIAQATGKYITNANSDDRVHAMKYEIMADVLDAREDIDVVYADQFICWDKPMTFEEFENAYAGQELKMGRYEDEAGLFAWPEYDRGLLGQTCFLGSAPMWRASLHQLYGGFGEHFKIAGDYEFWLRVSREKNMMHIPYPLGVYCARLDGVELREPARAREESGRAMQMHQDPEGLGVDRLGDLTRVSLAGSWVFANTGELIKAIDGQV